MIAVPCVLLVAGEESSLVVSISFVAATHFTHVQQRRRFVMPQYEYKIEEIQLSGTPGTRDQQLVEALNTFGRDGWRMVRVEQDAHLNVFEFTAKVLLERERTATTTGGQYTGETQRLP
jgi:hypothetical protein